MDNEKTLQDKLQESLALWAAAKRAQALESNPKVEFAVTADSQWANFYKTIETTEGKIVCKMLLDSNSFGEFLTVDSLDWPKPFILNGWKIANSYSLEEYK